jgi:hypothetical protein
LSGDTHADHDTICTFRRQNAALVAKFFVRVLELAHELKLLHQKKKENWEKNKRRGHEPKPPVSKGPGAKGQSNLTDPDSRIMRKSKNEAFAQAYNAQLAVDAEGSQLI